METQIPFTCYRTDRIRKKVWNYDPTCVDVCWPYLHLEGLYRSWRHSFAVGSAPREKLCDTDSPVLNLTVRRGKNREVTKLPKWYVLLILRPLMARILASRSRHRQTLQPRIRFLHGACGLLRSLAFTCSSKHTQCAPSSDARKRGLVARVTWSVTRLHMRHIWTVQKCKECTDVMPRSILRNFARPWYA